MKILFVDHVSHLKTHSADFFLDILRESFDVDTFYYEKTYGFTIPQKKVDDADIVIFWEFLYNRRDLGIPGKHCIFVPMYDNEWGSRWQWERIAASGMPVISFCDAITNHAKKHGVRHILDIRFAFNPADFNEMAGDPRKAALWERGQISLSNVERIFAPNTIDNLTIFRRPENGIAHKPIDKTGIPFHVDVSESAFLPPDEYRKQQKDFGVYIAPRYKEGIGMAFLEAMAMGKCVIANNDATMNEYIEDGKTGILRNFRKPIKPISATEIEAVIENAKTAAQRAYERWLKDKETIKPFVESAAELQPITVGSTTDFVKYMLFLLEGSCNRLLHQ